MKSIRTLTLGALGAVSLAAACSVESVEAPVEETGSSSEALVCANHQAVHSVMSTLAVNIMKEMGRIKPHIDSNKPGDFFWNYSTRAIELTQMGKDRCLAWNSAKNCAWTKATLNFFKWEYNGINFAGSVLETTTLQSRFEAAWRRQEVCIQRPDNGMNDNCPVQAHDLVFSSLQKPANSCSTDYWFHAYKAGTTQALTNPKQVANMLLWAGWDLDTVVDRNPWIAFDTQGDDVKIDPTMGLTDGNPVPMTSGGVAKLPYHYQGTPKYAAVVSPFENITNRPCMADSDRCTYPDSQVCPPATRYFGTSFPTAPAGGAASPTGIYYCVKTSAN